MTAHSRVSPINVRIETESTPFPDRLFVKGQGSQFMIHGPTRAKVLVSGPCEMLTIKEIVSLDRFCEYDESDLWWAAPLGLAKIVIREYQPGDRVVMSQFCDMAQFEMDAELLCRKSRRPKSCDQEILLELEFDVCWMQHC
jgi:hypothetical protein